MKGPSLSFPENLDPDISRIFEIAEYWQAVGSRVTCDPPVLDTDCDFLLFVHPERQQEMESTLLNQRWRLGGSRPNDVDLSGFSSFTQGDVNLIITYDEGFYHKFSVATDLTKRFNLLVKSDRIALFQGVLYAAFWRPT
jgi:hypothetical protein